jgi:hypothetical protein
MEEKNLVTLYDAGDATWVPHPKAFCHILISEQHVSKIIFDQAKQRFVSLYAAEFKPDDPELLIPSILSMKEDQMPTRWFLSVPKTLIVPAVLFEESIQKNLLENHQKIEENEVIASYPVKSIEAELVFAYDNFFSRIEKEANPGISFIPADSYWLSAIYLNNKQTRDMHAHVNIADGFISMAIFNGDKLQLYNTYPTITPEEVLYYVMFVSEQLHLNPKKDPYYYSGFIKKGDELMTLLNKYISNLKAEERPSQFHYSLPVVDVPGHLFFQTYCTALCES